MGKVYEFKRSPQWRTAKWAKEQLTGCCLVKLSPKLKQPPDKEWNKEGHEPPIEETWGAPDTKWGVGLILGHSKNGPVDIDIDCQEALFFSERFLPKTSCIFGREGKRRSHWIYDVPTACSSSKYLDPKTKETIIELRAETGGDGYQTRMPGSFTDKGDRVEWDMCSFEDPPPIGPSDAKTLHHATRKIALAVLTVRYLWPDHAASRHLVCMCLSGFFHRIKWPQSEAEAFIQAVMDFQKDKDPSRMKTVRSTYAKASKNKPVIGMTRLKKDLGEEEVIDKVLEWFEPGTSGAVMRFNDQFATTMVEGRFKVLETDVEPGFRRELLHKDEFLSQWGNQYYEDDEGKQKPLAKMWLSSPMRRSFRHARFLPGMSDDDLPPDTINLWTGWAVKPDPKGSCNAWLDLLFNTICGGSEEHYNWLFNWFAHLVQFPMDKVQTAPVIVGETGGGKTLLLEFFDKMLGDAYMQVSNSRHVHGNFNAHLRHVLLLHSEEALYGRDKAHRSVVKALTGNKKRINEYKGVDSHVVDNFLRLILTSNYDDAAPIEEQDRRFSVIDMAKRVMPQELVRPILKERDGQGPARLLHELQQFTCSGDLARQNLKGARTVAMMSEVLDPVQAWWWSVLQTGLLVPDYLRWATEPEDEPWPARVGIQALYRSFVEHLRSSGRLRSVPNDVAFGMKLGQMLGGHQLTRHKIQFHKPDFEEDKSLPNWVKELNGMQRAITNMPPLDFCRKRFKAYTRMPLEWDSEKVEMAKRSSKHDREDEDDHGGPAY